MTTKRKNKKPVLRSEGFSINEALADYRKTIKQPGGGAEARQGFDKIVDRSRNLRTIQFALQQRSVHSKHAHMADRIGVIAAEYELLAAKLSLILWKVE